MSNMLNENIGTMFEKMENFVSTKTVVGDAINIGDVILLPLVDVSFGLGAVNADTEKEKGKNGAGGGGLGAKIQPSAVLVVTNGNVQLVNVKNQDSLNKIIDMAPGVVSKISSFFSKDKDKTKAENEKDEKNEKETTEEETETEKA